MEAGLSQEVLYPPQPMRSQTGRARVGQSVLQEKDAGAEGDGEQQRRHPFTSFP